MIKNRESERRVILRDAPIPGGVGPTQTHLYMSGTKLMGQMHDDSSVPIIDFAAIPATVPVGAVQPFIGDVAPSGWGICDGSDYDTYDYRLLHQMISNKFGGTAYQTGVTNIPNAGLTFKVPDFQGRMLVMADPTQPHASAIGDSGGHNERPPLVEHDHTVDQSAANINSSTKILDIDNAGVGPFEIPADADELVELWSTDETTASPPNCYDGTSNTNPSDPPCSHSASYGGAAGHKLYPITTFGEVGLGGSLSLSEEGDPIPPNDTRNLPPYMAVNYILRLV